MVSDLSDLIVLHGQYSLLLEVSLHLVIGPCEAEVLHVHTHTRVHTHTQTLRQVLDSNGLSHTQIVAPDGSFDPLASNILKDKDLNASVSILG